MADEKTAASPIPQITWDEFIRTAPAAVNYIVKDLVEKRDGYGNITCNTTEILFYCPNCEGNRYFKCSERADGQDKTYKHDFVVYECKNCGESYKSFALAFRTTGLGSVGTAVKIGEWPPLSITTPSKVISFIGKDRETFLQGLTSEAQGLGIGSLAYYRRVVDNQWKRILEHLLKAAKNIHADPKAIEALESATRETQFKRAVEMVKDAIPPSLLLNGNVNPVTLLYSATSEGIHDLSDGQCLEIAKDIRIVLTELAERMTKALGDQHGLDEAVKRLQAMSSGAAKKVPPAPAPAAGPAAANGKAS